MTTATTTPVAAGTWTVDPVHSVVAFVVRHFGINWLRGGFTEFDIALTAAEDGALSLAGTAPVQAISFPNEQLHGHLMSPDFFDAELHPTLSFEADDVDLAGDGTATVRGTLTMRGTTNPIELTGTWAGPVQGLAGDERIGLVLNGEIDRHAYGISWNATLPTGQDAVAAKVKLSAELELVRA
ncbi:MAG: YceI family protein [Thermoleophilia bacterium]|nr:YceI family protein [Thermoleophilia bacterium]